MTSRRLPVLVGGALTLLLIATASGAGPPPSQPTFARRSISPTFALPARAPAPDVVLAVPATLTDPTLDLRDGPVPVPLELQMPSLGVNAAVLGVGINGKDVMDAPMGPADDPVWQQAFWYRGSAVPGAPSTALIAGHISGGGRDGVFAHLDALHIDDPIVIRDTRTGADVVFLVTETVVYPLEQMTDPVVLTQIYGAGPVAGTAPQPSTDRLAHLTLITCSGTFRNGTHDHRLVVYATRRA